MHGGYVHEPQTLRLRALLVLAVCLEAAVTPEHTALVARLEAVQPWIDTTVGLMSTYAADAAAALREQAGRIDELCREGFLGDPPKYVMWHEFEYMRSCRDEAAEQIAALRAEVAEWKQRCKDGLQVAELKHERVELRAEVAALKEQVERLIGAGIAEVLVSDAIDAALADKQEPV